MKYPDWFIVSDVSDEDIYVHVSYYSPPRSMPNCQNPNKDAFYDDGDPEEIEFDAWILFDIKGVDYKVYLTDDMKESIKDLVIKSFIEECEND